MIKNIFFDFDGVILDSVDCKTKAFVKMYTKYGKKVAEKVKSYHLMHGGISRFEKFKFWHKNYLNKNLDEKSLKILTDKFSKLVFEEVLSSKEIEGSFDFIKRNFKFYNLWIITGTPDDEIQLITQKLGISKYFKGIHGSPSKKEFWTEQIIKKFDLVREETIFIGDAKTDYDAAIKSRINFALREAPYNKNDFNSLNLLKFSSFNEFEKLLI